MDMHSTEVQEVAAGDQLQKQGRNTKGKGITINSLGDVNKILHSILYQNNNKAVDVTFQQIEQKTFLKREQIAYVIIGLAGLYMVFGAFARLMCNFIGFAYPAYASVKAIRTEDKEDDTHWLIYWTAFAAFTLVDFFAEFIFCYFPVYYVAKVLFMLYLYLPQTYGALVMYDRFVDPTITKIDAMLQKYAEEKKKE